MNNVGYGPFTSVDVRKRVCGRCQREYLPPGGGNGMCSDRCWMASRGRQEGQGAVLGRVWADASMRSERRIVGRARVNRWLADAAQENDIAAYKRERRETLELIDWAERRLPPPLISRGALPEKCTGPACPVCRAGRQLDAQRSAREAAEYGYGRRISR